MGEAGPWFLVGSLCMVMSGLILRHAQKLAVLFRRQHSAVLGEKNPITRSNTPETVRMVAGAGIFMGTAMLIAGVVEMVA